MNNINKIYYSKKNKSRYIIIILVLILLVISIGYSIYTQELDINGMVEGSIDFNVYFCETWVEDASKGTSTINKSNGSKSVFFSVNLDYPRR